jgi:Leucine-rich repeat (LRR) protein
MNDCKPFRLQILLAILAFTPSIVVAQIPTLEKNYVVYTRLEDAAKVHPDSVLAIKLARNKLRELPQQLFNYPNLEYLDLRNNRFAYVPDSIAMFPGLLELNLSGNPVDSISPSVGKLKKLRILRLGKTELVVLPPEIGELGSLEYLDIWGTFITWPPKEIARLSESLKILDMRVIRMNFAQQERVRDLVPSTEILFSKSCNCH